MKLVNSLLLLETTILNDISKYNLSKGIFIQIALEFLF